MTILQNISTGWKAYLLLALITFTASVPGVFMVPALDRDESRFAQASKQMLETGDFIQIRYQDEGRNKKPAGIHWLQAGAASVTAAHETGSDQIWAYRLPSLLGAILATLATFWGGQVLIGRRGAFLGAALFGAGLLLTSEAHIAKTDAVLVFLTALSMGALARLYMQLSAGGEAAERRQRWLMFLFWGALGASFLIKGPVTLMVAALAIGALCLIYKSAGLAKAAIDLRGLALFALIVLPWFIWVQIVTDGAFLEGAVGKDLTDKVAGASEGHGGPPGYHLAFVLVMFFPATLFLVPSISLAARHLRGKALDVMTSDRAGLTFLVAWFVPTWFVFELLPTKLSHYILPAYPALALICGWGLVQLTGGARAHVSRYISAGIFALGGLTFCYLVSPFGVDLLQAEAAGDFRFAATPEDVRAVWESAPDMALHWLIAGIGALLVAAFCFLGQRYGASLTLAIMSSLLVGWHVRTVFLPGATWLQPTVTARAALGEVCGLQGRVYKGCADPRPEKVQAVGYAEPSLVFTTGTKTVIPPQTIVALPDAEQSYPIIYLLNIEDDAGRAARQKLESLVAARGRKMTVTEPHYALNYSNGDPVAFVAVRID